MTAQAQEGCRDHRPNGTCIQRLAAGWIGHGDLCSPCAREFMAALDGHFGPLDWNPGFRDRATGSAS